MFRPSCRYALQRPTSGTMEGRSCTRHEHSGTFGDVDKEAWASRAGTWSLPAGSHSAQSFSSQFDRVNANFHLMALRGLIVSFGIVAL